LTLINKNLTKDSNGSSEIQILKFSKAQREHENFDAMGIGYARKKIQSGRKEQFIHNPKQASEGLVQNVEIETAPRSNSIWG
jgi:hypothetical protein